MNAAFPTRGSTIGEEKNANLPIGSSEIGGTTMCSPRPTVKAVPTSALLERGACCDIRPPVHEEYGAEFNALHMNWVLVDDTKGHFRAHMRWVGDR